MSTGHLRTLSPIRVAVQNSNVDYIYVDTPQAENDDDNDNDYKQFEPHEAKQQVLHYM